MQASYTNLTSEQVALLSNNLGQLFNSEQIGGLLAVFDELITIVLEADDA